MTLPYYISTLRQGIGLKFVLDVGILRAGRVSLKNSLKCLNETAEKVNYRGTMPLIKSFYNYFAGKL